MFTSFFQIILPPFLAKQNPHAHKPLNPPVVDALSSSPGSTPAPWSSECHLLCRRNLSLAPLALCHPHILTLLVNAPSLPSSSDKSPAPQSPALHFLHPHTTTPTTDSKHSAYSCILRTSKDTLLLLHLFLDF